MSACAKARSIVSVLPASVPSSRYAASRMVIGRPPMWLFEPRGSPDPAVPSVIAMMRSGRFAASAARIIAGCTWTPSQMSSAVISSDSSTAPASPGALWEIGVMALNRCVAWRAPARIPSCASS